jgi:hypothetical protein
MPSVSSKQHNFMEAVAHSPSFAKKAGVPQSVGQEFATADKGLKFKAAPKSRADLQRINKPETRQGKSELFSKGGKVMGKSVDAGMSKTMQKVKTAAPSRDGVASKGKTKGMLPKMAGNTIGTGKAMMKKGGMAKAKR